MIDYLLAAILHVGDCIFITHGPFTGHRAIIRGLPEGKRPVIRFCDSEVCIMMAISPENFIVVPQIECKDVG